MSDGKPDYEKIAFDTLRSLCSFRDPKDDLILGSDVKRIAGVLAAAYRLGRFNGKQEMK